MAQPKTNTAAKPKPKPTATQTAMPIARTSGRPSGKDFTPSEKYQYHKKETNKAFKADDFVKATNHLAAMRRAEKTLQEQAKWAKENKPR